MKIVILLLLGTIWLTGMSQHAKLPREIELILKYAQRSDYPEVFNNNPYQLRPIDWQIIDIDNDGVTEVFLQTFPHYRQSPTITIYQINAKDTVTRITEGLAPGRLIPLNLEDDYIDPHTTASAVDMMVDNANPKKMRVLAKSSLKFGMSPVLYKNFIHTDKRDGKPTYLDLSHLDYKSEKSCKNFQFSKPAAIIAGPIKDKTEQYFMALVDDEIYCYAIHGFTTDGLIDKELVVIQKPTDLKNLTVDNGFIKYLTHKGKKKELKLE